MVEMIVGIVRAGIMPNPLAVGLHEREQDEILLPASERPQTPR
jgi:hypothetical protein